MITFLHVGGKLGHHTSIYQFLLVVTYYHELNNIPEAHPLVQSLGNLPLAVVLDVN